METATPAVERWAGSWRGDRMLRPVISWSNRFRTIPTPNTTTGYRSAPKPVPALTSGQIRRGKPITLLHHGWNTWSHSTRSPTLTRAMIADADRFASPRDRITWKIGNVANALTIRMSRYTRMASHHRQVARGRSVGGISGTGTPSGGRSGRGGTR